MEYYRTQLKIAFLLRPDLKREVCRYELIEILKEDWGNDGSLIINVEIPGGLQEEFFDKLNGLTHGEVESRIIKEK